MPSRRPMLVVVGRSNFREYSASLNALIDDLQNAGYEVCRLETRNTETARWLDHRASRLLRRDASAGTALTRAIKALVLLTRPSRWDYFLASVENPNKAAARDLRRLTRSLPTEVCLVAHSAGGIVSTLAATEPTVTKIVCFGYPFRHPGHEDEPYRTAHLPTIAKPFLVVQGDQDDYGTAADSRRYGLSASTSVVSVAAGHDYDDLDPAEYDRCLQMVLDFLEG